MKSEVFYFLFFFLCTVNAIFNRLYHRLKSKMSQNVEVQYQLTYDGEEVFDGQFVTLLNLFQTVEKDKIVFNQSDVSLLSWSCKMNTECIENKLRAIAKYRRKIQAIQCMNGIIVTRVLEILINLLKNDTTNQSMVPSWLRNIKDVMEHMLSVLYISKSLAYPWQITVFSHLIGVLSYGSLKSLKNAHFQEDANRSFSEMSMLNHACRVHGFIGDHGSNSVNEFTENLYRKQIIEKTYVYGYLFTASNFGLVNLYKQHAVIIREVPELSLDWTATKKQLNADVRNMTDLMNSKQWVTYPFRYTNYHHFIQNIVYANVEYFVWIHLNNYQYSLNKIGSSKSKAKALNRFWRLLIQPLEEAIHAFHTQDNFYRILCHHLMNDKLTEKKHIDRMVSTVRHMLEQHLKSLKVTNVTLNGVISLNVTDRSNPGEKNIEQFKKYISSIKLILQPFDLFFIQFFTKAKTNSNVFTGKYWNSYTKF